MKYSKNVTGKLEKNLHDWEENSEIFGSELNECLVFNH